MERIADAATGNARDAIGVLGKVARAARENSADIISDEFVKYGIKQIQSEVRKPIDKFSPHYQMLYAIAEEEGEVM
ncbi:hypothetical protein [Halorussus amylolyticus]|uniref:hypothetical protein n=1 Tax=Halorussus amylolyticus TaxID=1126242 RepID=UPI001045ECB8|nr:hypothetical protein [Halorussus amylolyticus]